MYRGVLYPGEVRDITLATLAVFASLAGQYLYTISPLGALRLLALAFLVYVPHELAHKFTAQFYGYPARYSIVWELFILTLLTALPFVPVKFIAPGTVYVYAGAGIGRRENGIISAAGPATNILLGVVGLLAGGPLATTISRFSGWIALFNLLPFGPLDGRKVLSWSPPAWALMLAAAAALLIL